MALPTGHHPPQGKRATAVAWLGHNDVKALNSLDSLVEENGQRFVKHYLIDFGAAFGSDSFTAKSPRAGNQYLFDVKPAAAQFFTLGLYVPRWAHAKYPHVPAVGRFESKIFEPEKWKPNYPNPSFDNRSQQQTPLAGASAPTLPPEVAKSATGEYFAAEIRSAEPSKSVTVYLRNKAGRLEVVGIDRTW